jgi:hypothetical protein
MVYLERIMSLKPFLKPYLRLKTWDYKFMVGTCARQHYIESQIYPVLELKVVLHLDNN